ncbi:sodium-dependent phosphate transporter 1-A-like isoform X1 [Haliotis rufescens]|uniref:sodium-dependent phosphate transporter 1-A-like isoform X1 n=1 Tax=Haliotis rufescens TaxID=6454 RepID=UPI00201EDA4C|nr:sodium-dependent phosphate transporter 1-A-like isoform X1 [Haliotis rufescens]XP_046357091.2 sodium-dependent phosphate transporter 1-A-like isoform X1 [Haliotis rufescens]XP_046357092.2 sodium-dependent phosphate transporter 1-A-like isoform X1 [Haliotis rufescens]XP_046357093.2 sodium-dependent phosphate transporter 1-A-like isoform X1 [Haliotis rufescens]XP_046357094.2 sodium-dependent phosphate transporter 1-A-like isoform X1 [Haliotis rufescens]XP_046357095.2 sodium-dependent phosphat
MLVPEEWLWMVIVGFIIAFVLAFGIGANDVANSFGTSVGAKVLSLRQACILATIFEVAGAILIGSRVSDTIRKGIIDVSAYNGSEALLMVGNVAALSGSCVMLIGATIASLPISATHSIVGATIGFSVVAHGARGIGWMKLGLIIGSWFISPVMSGIVSSVLFFLVRKFVLNKEKPLEPGLRLLPVFYGVTVVINAFSVFYEGSEMLHFDRIPLYGVFILSFGLGLVVALLVYFVIVPWQRKRIQAYTAVVRLTESEEGEKTEPKVDIYVPPTPESATGDSNHNTKDEAANNQEDEQTHKLLNGGPEAGKGDADVSISTGETEGELETDNEARLALARKNVEDKPETAKLFSFLQILTAVFGSFAHGGNDVSNAIGPVVALWMISIDGTVSQKAATPVWILLYGGVGISIGLCVLGRRVMKTMGEDLSKVTPSSGFCIEIGSALTVLIASNIGIPISTTHCKVGSIVFVGRVRSNENVDWKLFRNIIIAWLVTLPISGLLSAAAFAGLRELI